MRIQYISDIHLEHYKIYTAEQLNPLQWIEPDPAAELLVLAGDIGCPSRAAYSLFLQWCSANWPQVVVIAGNHEFYRAREVGDPTSREEVLGLIRRILAHMPNVRLLDREAVTLRPGLQILGCTLWSDIPEDMRTEAAWGLNDFRLIPGASTEAYAAWHARDLAWLRAQLFLLKNTGEEAIVVTHHMPTPRLVAEKYRGHPLNCCFATDLEQLIEDTQPLAWICGHSHTGNRLLIGRTQLVLNPHGYPGERVETRRRRATLEVTASTRPTSPT
jgi:DNA repair exonuclease SbcCD nuclease subunit